jgi:hypothetical protein
MGKRTLYIRDSDEELWQRAEQMAKELGPDCSLSKLVTDALEKEMERLATAEEIKEGIEKIVVKIETGKGTRKVAFNGRWLVEDYGCDKCLISVALTEKDSYFVYCNNQGYEEDDYQVFDYFEEFKDCEEIPDALISMVASEVGEEYVEFLNI